MFKLRYSAVLVLIVAAAIGAFVWMTNKPDSRFAFKLGLDLSGGSHLVYNADTSKIPAAEVSDAMNALQTVIERRVNAFGVGEPVVQTEQA
ncbi:protein translocase subunit SecD, partial [Patescibacteria group bacterium]|nr:protein translocase subunit SecD [Patescibacteria group bacterium]